MLEAVFLGVCGVLLPRSAFDAAQVESAADALASHGVPRGAFQRAASLRLAETGHQALWSRTLQDLGIPLAPEVMRSIQLQARQAIPLVPSNAEFRAALRDLASRFEVGFLDPGEPDVLEAVLSRFHLRDLGIRRFWTACLGDLARPPRRLAFRWLAQRLGLRPSSCLYVAGSRGAWTAAVAAGWNVWPRNTASMQAHVDPWEMVEAIDRFERTA